MYCLYPWSTTERHANDACEADKRGGREQERAAGVAMQESARWGWLGKRASHDLRHDFTAYDSAQTMLAAAPQRATLLTSRDEDTFALWYLQKVKSFRRDVLVVDTRLAAHPS